MQQAELVVVGAGAAGLMAAIWAKRESQMNGRARRVLALDSAVRLGAKILVSGGGRCNVTHDFVDETAFAGSSRHAIRRVLQRFDAARTAEFFHEIGVSLKREETGKLFPTTNDAQTVLDALLAESRRLGVELAHPRRVERIARVPSGAFEVGGDWGCVAANRVVLATGGQSLPKTGSDGFGYALARRLGHKVTQRIFPALVPLLLPEGHFIRELSGLTLPTRLELRTSSGKRIVAIADSTLCTHFGLSGPSVLDISRHYINAKLDDPDVQLVMNWLPDETEESTDRWLQTRDDRSVIGLLRSRMPERLGRALCAQAGVDANGAISRLPREARRSLVQVITSLRLPISGDRGFKFAEVTAGGVPLSELNLATLESRVCPGLFVCGEVCDVDGRIGGYNFQWAWSSGYVAGASAAQS